MTTPHYVIRGGMEGRERLRVLARVMAPTTNELLARIGVEPTARCLDVGCGGGYVTVALARLATEGSVVGVDRDETNIGMAREEAAGAGVSNVEFRAHDVMEPALDGDHFDVVYARFVLTTCSIPRRCWPTRARILRLAACSSPRTSTAPDTSANPIHRRSGATSSSTPRRCSAEAAIRTSDHGCRGCCGRRASNGSASVVQPAGISGDVKLLSPLTLEAIADAALAAGLATDEELGELVDELYAFAEQDGTLMGIPRVVQAWGRKPQQPRTATSGA